MTWARICSVRGALARRNLPYVSITRIATHGLEGSDQQSSESMRCKPLWKQYASGFEGGGVMMSPISAIFWLHLWILAELLLMASCIKQALDSVLLLQFPKRNSSLSALLGFPPFLLQRYVQWIIIP
jgi:hypothetical protein